jgi:small subunit ribosomal protein S29
MTEYAPIAGTPLYSQPVYAAAWLGQIGKANAEILSQLTVTKRHDLPIPLPENTTLGRLTELGARDSEIAWPIFEAFWSEITSAGRPPILLTIDGLSHVMKESTYRSPEFELIHTHDLAIINLFVQHLSGSKKLPNGGAVFAATSKGNAPLSYATSIAIKQQVERQRGEEITKADPFKIIDERAFKSLQKAKVLELNGLSKTEARGLMEYWAASGVLRSRIDEQTVAEKWALAGHGVVGEIERTVLRMRI